MIYVHTQRYYLQILYHERNNEEDRVLQILCKVFSGTLLRKPDRPFRGQMCRSSLLVGELNSKLATNQWEVKISCRAFLLMRRPIGPILFIYFMKIYYTKI